MRQYIRMMIASALVLIFAGCSDSITVSDSLPISDDAPRSTDFDVDPEARKEQLRLFPVEPEDDAKDDSQPEPDPDSEPAPQVD